MRKKKKKPVAPLLPQERDDQTQFAWSPCVSNLGTVVGPVHNSMSPACPELVVRWHWWWPRAVGHGPAGNGVHGQTRPHSILQQWQGQTEPMAQVARGSFKSINFEIWGESHVLLLSMCCWRKGGILCVFTAASLFCVSVCCCRDLTLSFFVTKSPGMSWLHSHWGPKGEQDICVRWNTLQ